MLLDMLVLGAGIILNEFGCNNDYDYSKNSDDNTVPYTCTDEWRSINPWGYNPVTGGWTAEEDHQNGW